ncbi:hypothetical protein OHA98_20460 [Streptomyces sp. NBC_00654]|uniref:hypothetical protein n=1 Tax=Streptomyces sp. NBC_00654 TaxID=2975799 RepID=UPI00224F2BE6|nr:hypothetical protein [Streptomyces sp. NBC_00654]MCX4967122.1 hypothetical protein [Streptomyces sp. NBC_00654]
MFDFVDFLATGAVGAAFNSDEAEVRKAAVALGLTTVRQEIDPSYDSFGLFAGGVEFLFEDAELMCVQFEVERTGPLDLSGSRIDQSTTLEEFTRALDQVGIGWSSGLLHTGETVVTTTGWVHCYFTADEPHCFVTAISAVT